jgi:hypothetical protein
LRSFELLAQDLRESSRLSGLDPELEGIRADFRAKSVPSARACMPETIGVRNRCRRPNHAMQAGSFDCTSCLVVLHNQRNAHTLGVHADGIQCSSVIQALESTRAAILSF